MGALIGLGVGVGLVLCWSAFALPRVPREPSPRRPGRVASLLARAGLGQVSASGFVLLCAACALLVGLVIELVSGAPPVALAFAAMAGYLPVVIVNGRARRRQREFAEVWPEAVDNLASAVRAGMSLPEAVAGLADRGPEALRPAFAAFGLDYQVSGRFGDALDRLKERLADPVGDRVVEGLRIAREVGGGELGRILRNLSGYLREDARTRSELEARQAWTVNGARLAVSAPWLVLLLMSFQSDVIHRYATPGGTLVLAVGGGLCVVAYRAMMRLGRLPTERRILSSTPHGSAPLRSERPSGGPG
ncbi:MAG: type II secretion system F family protein [Nocardioides sp.]|uniref:type II secretion system F family protein n=1 Tax=Nocardioides sp. TaxID=35761 RepID=UPI0039E43B31